MTDKEIQQIADRVIAAVENLAPGPTGWWVIAAPIAVFLAAIVAAIVGGMNLRKQRQALEQKSEADARSEWWRRTQWALEATVSEDAVMSDYGSALLDVLSRSDLAGPEEASLLEAVWQGTGTEMEDEPIELLLDDAEHLGLLSKEDEASVRDFELRDEHPVEPKGDSQADLNRHPAGGMDDSIVPVENEGSKEDDNDVPQNVRPR